MAPVPERPESFFLAPLDKCLGGHHRLISWTTAFDALSNVQLGKSSPNLEWLISDEAALEVLSKPFDPFSPPSPQTKADFETRTAAINITPSNNGHYDIEQIKADVIWLSERAKIDEIQSTRLVVLEWQQQAASKILQGYSEEENISLQQAIGGANLGVSVLSTRQPQPARGDDEKAFASSASRRARHLRLFLAERKALLGISLLLFVAGQKAPGDSTREPVKSLPWLQDSGVKMRSMFARKAAAMRKDYNFVSESVSSIRKKFGQLESSSGLSDGISAPEQFEEEHLMTVTVELIRMLQLLFGHMSSPGQKITPNGMASWFEFADSIGFLERFEPPSSVPRDLAGPMRILVSLITLQILNLPTTLESLYGDQASATPPVVFDPGCCRSIHEALTNAAEFGSSVAGPAIFAWSIISQNLREMVQPQLPESPMEDDTSGRGRSPVATRHVSASVPQIYQDALAIVVHEGEGSIFALAQMAIDACAMFPTITSIAQLVEGFVDPSSGQVLALRARLCLLELVRQALTVSNYNTDVLDTTLAILGQSPRPRDAIVADRALRARFLQDDDILKPQLLNQAQSRYPYEASPSLALCRALSLPPPADFSSNGILQFGTSSRFTHSLPRHFGGYELVDGNANCVKLISPLPLFLEQKQMSAVSQQQRPGDALVVRPEDEENDLCLSRGTIGYVLNDTRPFVVMWEHEHSVFRYVANLLSTVPSNSTRRVCSDQDNLEPDTLADLISFLATELLATVQASDEETSSPESDSTGQSILREASDGLDRNQDVISLISEIFEEELSQSHLQRQQASTAVLTSCILFLRASLKLQRSRVWSILARSSLLDLNSTGGRLPSVVASIEMPSGHYNFLLECLSLFEALVEDIISHAVTRTAPSSAMVPRFEQHSQASTAIPLKVTSSVLSTLTSIFMDVLSSSSGWNFASESNRVEMNTRIITLFNRITTNVYGYDDVHNASEKLTAALALSAKQLVDSFLASSPNTISIYPLLNIIVSTDKDTLHHVFISPARLETCRAHAAVEFLTKLIEISILLDTPASYLEHQSFLALPSLTRLYVAEPTLKTSLVSLLLSLVNSADRSTAEPSSLLGHLGSSSAKCFLVVLGDLNRPLGDPNLESRILALLCAVVSKRQQWFASFLLTGDTPKNALAQRGDSTSSPNPPPSVLDFTADALAKTSSLHALHSVAMLEFISLAQSYFPWVTTTLHRHEQFLSNCLEYVGELAKQVVRADTEQAYQNRAAALIADILAMYLHNMRQLGDSSFLKTVVPKLGFYRENAVTPPTYNTSLHTNLKRNFENTFPKRSPSDFKGTVGPRKFGPNFFYDTGFAGEVLGSDPAWHGSRERTKGRGFANEFARANVNLSLVESQISLFTSWKALAIELSRNVAEEKGLQKQLVNVVHQCLLANTEPQPSDAVFDSLTQHRADLAIVLLQRLVDAKSESANIKNLVSAAWDAARASGQDFEVAFTGPNADYYRSLLRILLLSLQPHTYIAQASTPEKQKQHNGSPHASMPKPPETASILAEVTFEVVAKGFRSLARQLHEDSTSVVPSDFLLVKSIFQSILRVRGAETISPQLTLRLCDVNVSRYATALYSWSSQLVSANDDPVYGELSVSFLRELSSIPSMAEFLATEGILANIAAAHISETFRQAPKGIGPFTEPPRLHIMWSRSILPLVLNVLAAVGDSFAAETAAFLNMFPQQLARTASSFDLKAAPTRSNPYAGNVTLNEAAEVHTLSLIALALDKCRDSPVAAANGGVPELLWDRADVKEDVEALVNGRRAALRDRIVPTSERELQLSRAEPLRRSGPEEDRCQNRLEEMVLEELLGALACLGSNGS